jgi:Tol biopolymer transport system component
MMKKNKYWTLVILILFIIGIGVKMILLNRENEVDKLPLLNKLKQEDSIYCSNVIIEKVKYEIKNIQSITFENHFTAPIWSPDGTKILVTANGNSGLYVIYLNNNNSIKKINDQQGAGYNASWSEDSKNILYREKIINSDYSSSFVVKSINIETNEISKLLDINPNCIASNYTAKKNNDPIVYTNTKTLLIEAQYLDKSKTWIVTNDSGQYYQAILSPDKTKVVVHKGAEMLVYDINGNGLMSSIGKGIACGWSRDSKKVLYFLDESVDGHQITGSEIYLANADGSSTWQLTNTPDVYEMFPSWSPDNRKIVYSDDKSGKIFIADIVSNSSEYY